MPYLPSAVDCIPGPILMAQISDPVAVFKLRQTFANHDMQCCLMLCPLGQAPPRPRHQKQYTLLVLLRFFSLLRPNAALPAGSLPDSRRIQKVDILESNSYGVDNRTFGGSTFWIQGSGWQRGLACRLAPRLAAQPLGAKGRRSSQVAQIQRENRAQFTQRLKCSSFLDSMLL